jgi:hypothetical protein
VSELSIRLVSNSTRCSERTVRVGVLELAVWDNVLLAELSFPILSSWIVRHVRLGRRNGRALNVKCFRISIHASVLDYKLYVSLH